MSSWFVCPVFVWLQLPAGWAEQHRSWRGFHSFSNERRTDRHYHLRARVKPPVTATTTHSLLGLYEYNNWSDSQLLAQTGCCNTSVCRVERALDLSSLQWKGGAMWMRLSGGRQSRRPGGYFNSAHGEVYNYHQVLACVTERDNECLDNTAETPPCPLLPPRTVGRLANQLSPGG